MTLNSLSPAFVRISYHTAYAPHVATIPTRDWIPPTGGHDFGSYTAWDSSSVDADVMIQALATDAAKLFPTTTHFDGYEIFTQATPTSPILPRSANVIGIAGTIVSPGFTEAVQSTFVFFDTAFNTAKLVFLDSDSTNDFRPKGPGDIVSPETLVVADFTALDNAWSSRGGFRPSTFRKLTQTLNEKLRRSYHQN